MKSINLLCLLFFLFGCSKPQKDFETEKKMIIDSVNRSNEKRQVESEKKIQQKRILIERENIASEIISQIQSLEKEISNEEIILNEIKKPKLLRSLSKKNSQISEQEYKINQLKFELSNLRKSLQNLGSNEPAEVEIVEVDSTTDASF